MADLDAIARRLGEQVTRGQVVLFTGAGFSRGATDGAGREIPQVRELQSEIWDLVWPGESATADSTLADTYAAAYAQKRNALRDLMRNRLSVSPESVTAQHVRWLSVPWIRAYTLNIDDLETAASRRHALPRRIREVSALARSVPLDTTEDLRFLHLNGTLDDVPDVTFADPQYGARHTHENPLYDRLAADLVAYPVVFVGTQLRESLFWQYLEMRDARGARGTSEMRPRSYLVTPDLPRDRQALLTSYNVEWVPLTADEFADKVLANISAACDRGHARRRLTTSARQDQIELPRVSALASLPAAPGSEYLLGARPEWADITSGRAAERQFEAGIDIETLAGCVLVTGTAGAGVSTTLLRIALRSSAAGRDVRWIDSNHGFDARELSRHLRGERERLTIVIDDADTFGRPLADLVNDVLADTGHHTLVIGMRASRVDRFLGGRPTERPAVSEVNVPLLEDRDIDALLEVLDRNNKLGALRRLTDPQRREAIRVGCGRELLIAMVEATSGKRFEVKVHEEFSDLEAIPRLLYGITALASELRFGLAKDELLLASGDISNTTLYALDRLVARKLLTQRPDGFFVRHRRIAELVSTQLRRSGEMYAPYSGLLRSIAVRADPQRRSTRETKLLSALLSHERVQRSFAMDDARRLYAGVEEALSGDYHFWLQRGSLEVEVGSLPAARNYLQQAFAGGERDFRVSTEWAYYLIKDASRDPSAATSVEQVGEAQEILLDQIARRGKQDPYLYHVYGSQMLSWFRRARVSDEERASGLEAVKNRLRDGTLAHPSARDLEDLYRDVENEWLSLAVLGD